LLSAGKGGDVTVVFDVEVVVLVVSVLMALVSVSRGGGER